MSTSQFAGSSSTNMNFVYGNWRSPSPVERDLEAQVVIAGNHQPFTPIEISAPASIYAHQSRTLPSSQPTHEEGTDPIDDFFGASHSRTGTRDSRHDAYMTPPPYEAEPIDPPAYSEYPTLAMYLFKFGFRMCLLSFLKSQCTHSLLARHSIPTILGRRNIHPLLNSASTRRVGIYEERGRKDGPAPGTSTS